MKKLFSDVNTVFCTAIERPKKLMKVLSKLMRFSLFDGKALFYLIQIFECSPLVGVSGKNTESGHRMITSSSFDKRSCLTATQFINNFQINRHGKTLLNK